MKIKQVVMFFWAMLSVILLNAQDPENFIACKVDGKAWKAEARKMKIPVAGFEYLALGAFQVSPDVQVWIRMYYFTDSLKPGSYAVIPEDDLESDAKLKADADKVWVLIDYSEETKGMGHAFHDGESLSGTLIIDKVSKSSVEGRFDATLRGVYYVKRAMATMSGSGIRGNLEKKIITKSGGGMYANDGPHDHENTRKDDKTDTIVLSEGTFRFNLASSGK